MRDVGTPESSRRPLGRRTRGGAGGAFRDDGLRGGRARHRARLLGAPVVAEELDRQLPKARNGGVLSIDLLLEARARGFEAELLEGDPAAIADSIGEGVPAIILVRVLNAPRSRADLYHYVVVDGHDPARGLLRLHFGDGIKRWAEAARIERAWKPAGHLMLRVRPAPGAKPA